MFYYNNTFDGIFWVYFWLVLSDAGDIRHLQGNVVTQLSLDHGMIDNTIYFTCNEVLGGVPIKKGDLVNCIAIRCGAEEGWKAIRVRTLFFVLLDVYEYIYISTATFVYFGFCIEMSLEEHYFLIKSFNQFKLDLQFFCCFLNYSMPLN